MHRWDVSVKEATAIQKEMQRRVTDAPLPLSIRYVAGADVSFARFSDIFHAGVVVLSYPDLEVVESAFATMRVSFPYVPGYLSFREVPAIAAAYEKLLQKPDVLMMDGHGIAHPRRIGVAAHLGLALDIATVGCAKSRLYGEGVEPDDAAGSVSFVRDPKNGDVIGAYVRTKSGAKPVIVSPGHKADLWSSVLFALSCTRGFRVPEPTRQAHRLVNLYRTGRQSSDHAA